MRIVEKKDEDLQRWPIGATIICGQYSRPEKKEGCGTSYTIEGREDWYEKTFYAGGTGTPYQSQYTRCPNCGRENHIPFKLEV